MFINLNKEDVVQEVFKDKDVKTENYYLMFGDCLERMKEIPDASVDVCISDIPYGIDFDEWDVTHNNSNSALLGQSPKNVGSKLFKSRGKPLNGWSQEDKLRTRQFQDWCSTWLSEVYRVLKPCSPILILCGRQNQHRFTCASEDAGFILKDVITWNKGKAPFRAQKVSNIYEQRGLPLDYEGDWRLGNLSPYCEPIIYMFKPYKVGTTITDQFMENKLGCFDANILTKNIVACCANTNISSLLNTFIKYLPTTLPLILKFIPMCCKECNPLMPYKPCCCVIT
jgi:site-specific DNA-methyltransferase (adenine-specific)